MRADAVAPGHLYVVATPIGNLGDITARAVDVLRGVDRILAEDTRTSAGLLRHLDVRTPMAALHEHNERARSLAVIEQLQDGQALALISDAGTPLISDPGYVLVRDAHAAGVPVVPVPGASSVMAALSVAGLPTDRFRFLGFLPSKAGARQAQLRALRDETGTSVLFETPHRIDAALDDAIEALGPARPAVLARELTKQFETVMGPNLGQIRTAVQGDANQRRGEMVLMIGPAPAASGDEDQTRVDAVLDVLLSELPVKQAAGLAARICGARRNAVYARAVARASQA